MKRGNCMLALVLSTSLLSLSPAHAGKPGGGSGGGGSAAYTVLGLASELGGVTGVNNHNELVGYLSGANGSIPCYWTVNATGIVTLTELPLGNHAWGQPKDINEVGMIVGEGQFWLTKNSVPDSLPVPIGTERVRAEAINDHGIIVGSFEDPDGNDHAAAWAVRADRTITEPLDLGYGPETGSGYAVCWDVNNSGMAVGQLDGVATRWQLAADGQALTLLWSESLYSSPEIVFSTALAINHAGDICGALQVDGSDHEAFLLMQLDDGLVEVPLPEDDNRRQDTQNEGAYALNNASIPQILGTRYVIDLRQRVFIEADAAVLWQGDRAINLEQATGQHFFAAINDNGWIVGKSVGNWFPLVMIPN